MPLGDKAALIASGAYLLLLTAGDGEHEIFSQEYFPEGSAYGYEGLAGFAAALPWAKGLELRITGHLREYVFKMNASRSDARFATSAADRYLGGNLAMAYRY